MRQIVARASETAWARALARFVAGALVLFALFFAVVALFSLFATAGCSSTAPVQGPKCNPACGVGSVCVGAVCKKVCTRQTDCLPGGYCNDEVPASWCEASPLALTAKPGQFRSPCKALSDCDTVDGFACYASGTADATAFCTLFDCASDSECPGGWWCARVNEAPNIATDKRSFGKTLNWCLPREYCAPCKADHDCQSPLSTSETEKHCVQDASGSGFCSPQCASNTNCPTDAPCAPRWTVCGPKPCRASADCPLLGGVAEKCFAGACQLPCTSDGDCPPSNQAPQRCSSGACLPAGCASDDDCPPTAGTYQHCNAGACTPECSGATDCAVDQTCQVLSVCSPRAGACVGDGSFCSPCQSDADCKKGYCLDAGPYSTERFCSEPVAGGGKCSAVGLPMGGCPPVPPRATARGVSCTISASSLAPADQCIGYVLLGTSAGTPQQVPGCWTPNR